MWKKITEKGVGDINNIESECFSLELLIVYVSPLSFISKLSYLFISTVPNYWEDMWLLCYFLLS